MYQKILDALQKKYAGVNTSILERIAKKLSKTVKAEDQLQEAVDGVTIQQLIDSEGDARATQATASAVKNYEEKYKLKDGKAIQVQTTEEPDDEGDEDEDEEGLVEVTNGDGKKGKKQRKPSRVEKLLKTIAENQKTLTDRLDAMEKGKTATTRKQRLDDLLKEASDSIKTHYTRDFDRLNFKDDADFDSWLEEQQTFIEADIKTEKSRNVVNTPPFGTSARKEGEADPMVAARAQRLQHQGAGVGVIQGLPMQQTQQTTQQQTTAPTGK